MVEIMGHQGLGWEGAASSRPSWRRARLAARQGHHDLRRPQEIQNNIIAKRILGLLDHQ